jgi:hypothetical protein
MRKLSAALALLLALIGVMVPTVASAHGSRPTSAGHMLGASRPGSKEYRVSSELTIDLGTGVQGGVAGTNSFKCVNDNGGFGFSTTTDQIKRDLWIDASESIIPPCITVKSYQYFDMMVASPYKGSIGLVLAEDETGKPARSPYQLKCTNGYSYHLACKQTGQLSVTITCVPVGSSPCVDTSSNPKINCTPEVHLKEHQQVVNEHICTSTGDPLPTVTTTESPLPGGLWYSRYPDNNGTWIVINGTVNAPRWSGGFTAFHAAPSVASTVHWDIQPG